MSAIDDFIVNENLVAQVFPRGTGDYHKACIALAYDLARKDVESAKTVLKNFPIDYLANIMPKQMEEDALFCSCACKLAEIMRETIPANEQPGYKADRRLILPRAQA